MTNQTEITESIDSYLGEAERNVLKTITKDKLKMFLKQRIQLNKSYLIKGDYDTLMQFKAFYLTLVNKEVNRMKYSYIMLTEYVDKRAQGDVDSLVIDELLFLHSNPNDTYVTGTSKSWSTAVILNEVANRNRKQLVTIILSEKGMPEIETSSELEVVNFYNTLNKDSKVKAVNKVVDKQVKTKQNFKNNF